MIRNRTTGRGIAGRAQGWITAAVLGLLIAPALVVVAEAVGSVGIAQAAGTLDIKPGDDFLPDFPDCGSKNIDTGTVRFRSNIGSGSTIFVGQTITIKASMNNTILTPANGNDGPDPLILKLQPTGYLQQAAPTKGSKVDYQTAVTFAGDGFHGPIAPVGDWGYKFDANSSPGFSSSDGTDEMITISFTATAPGEIDVKRLEVTGHDGTPIAGDVKCSIATNWYWNVIPISDPVATIDFAYVDARYTAATPSDATTGRHGILIDVLANDSDPNESLGFDLDRDVRIASWGPNLDCGPAQLNGVTPTVANFDGLAKGPCTYYPTIDDELSGGTTYSMVQRSGLRQASSEVIVNVVPNYLPVVSDDEVEMLVNSAVNNVSLLALVVDPENEALTCVPSSAASDVGSFSVTAGCDYSFAYAAFVPTDATATYLVCDTHTTLQNAGTGDAVRAPSYDKDTPGSNDDLTAASSRRCATGTLTFHIRANASDLLPPIQVRNDVDKIDAGYPLDNNGPYNLLIPVLDNDDFLGGSPTSLTVNAPPPAFQGVATHDGNGKIRFRPADLYVGPVSFSYRVCADIGNPVQNVCKTAKVLLTVVGNLAPKPKPDDFGILYKDPYVRSVVANDAEPQLEALICSTTLVAVNPANAFTSVALAPNCQLSFQSAAAYVGVATVDYRVCDNHKLLDPKWDDPSGYGPFDIPGGNAPRCATSTATMTFADAVSAPVPADGPGNKPTCYNDAFATVANVSTLGDVTANDTDLDESNLPSPVALADPDDPATAQGGTFANEAGKLRYVPAPGFAGIDTAVYNGIDTDGNGCAAMVTYTVKPDTDGDGIANDIDPDIDGDGIPNDLDPDMDGDGIANDVDPDMDGDGIPNDQDPDSNSDGLPDGPAPSPAPAMPTGGILPATGSASMPIALGAVLVLGSGLVLVSIGGRHRPRRVRRTPS